MNLCMGGIPYFGGTPYSAAEFRKYGITYRRNMEVRVTVTEFFTEFRVTVTEILRNSAELFNVLYLKKSLK